MSNIENNFHKLDEYIISLTNTPLEDHPIQIKNVYNHIKRYIETMNITTRASNKDGAAAQRDLYNTFIMALNTDARTSFTCLNIILYVFNQYKQTVFGESFVYRYIDKVNLAAKQLRCFRYLVHLFMATANPATRRDNLRRVNLSLVADELPMPICKENLIRYYNITSKM